MINSRHRRFYSKREDKKKLPKMQIKSGMIIEFMYRDRNGNPSRPLVFVMDTNEYVAANKKTFSGLNLNHLPHTEVEKMFINMGTKVGWELDLETKFPKLDLYEEENVGVRPSVIFKPFVKAKILNRFDCWRTYKYNGVKSVSIIKWKFQSKELKDIYKNLSKKKNYPDLIKPEKPKVETKKPQQPKKPKGGINENKL